MASTAAPTINGSVWWTLRSRFQQSLPSAVTLNYLSTVLSAKENTARGVLANLKLLGLVSEDGKPTELANLWRDDEQYAAACAEIARHAYPDELLSAVPGPNPNARAATQWFQLSRRLGSGAAGNAARTYALVVSGKLDPDKETSAAKKKSADGTNRQASSKTKGVTESGRKRPQGTSTRNGKGKATEVGFEMPRPQIAVQVNIAPNMTPEQIDQIFSSMAKHFYNEAGVE